MMSLGVRRGGAEPVGDPGDQVAYRVSPARPSKTTEVKRRPFRSYSARFWVESSSGDSVRQGEGKK